MEIVPKDTQDPNEDYRVYSEGLDLLLSDEAQVAKNLNRLPSNKERKQRFLSAINEAFELVGGVPRLALWADKNYGQFIKLAGRTLPTLVNNLQINSKGPVQIFSPIPPTELDIIDVTPEKVNEDKADETGSST